jgi:hypothetical protein
MCLGVGSGDDRSGRAGCLRIPELARACDRVETSTEKRNLATHPTVVRGDHYFRVRQQMTTPRLVLAAIVLLVAGARAAPPENADPALSPWFQSLAVPGTGISCCSIADCRPTDYRTVGDHYEALIEDKWVAIPPRKVLQRTDNPVGRAVVCWTPERGVMCFVRGTET